MRRSLYHCILMWVVLVAATSRAFADDDEVVGSTGEPEAERAESSLSDDASARSEEDEAWGDVTPTASTTSTQGEPTPSTDAVLLSPEDPAAQQGRVVGAHGLDPGWRDPRVAERAPNLYGQTGLRRTISARPGKNGYFSLGLSGRGFYVDDFIATEKDPNTFVGAIEHFGVGLFDAVELGIATQLATNQNERAKPSAQFTTGDLLASAKYGYAFGPYVAGADLRFYLPTSQEVGLDWQNYSATLTGLLTIDFYEEASLPLRLHFNAGYTLQNAHRTADRDKYFADELSRYLLAMTTNQWFYDQVSFGVGIEGLFPYVAPYLEIWSQTSLFVSERAGPSRPAPTLLDSHLTVTPGARFSVGRGLNFDVACDLGLLGTGGGFSPSIQNLMPGQPVNPAYAVHFGLSYTFSPFVAETQVEVRETEATFGQVRGCVTDTKNHQKIEDAVVEFEGTAGPRIVVDDQGCFVSPLLNPGSLVINVKHPDHLPGSAQIEVVRHTTVDATVELEPAPRYGRLEGFLTNQKDQRVDGVLLIKDAQGNEKEHPTDRGQFDIRLAPGLYQVLVKSPKYLQQGAPIDVQPLAKISRNFVLKALPQRRVSAVTDGKIEIDTQIPFELANARLLRAAEFILDDVVDVILSNPHFQKIRIEGHTDNQGNPAANLELSAKRAEAVKEYLVAKGIDANRLDARGFGAERPLTSNSTAKGRAQNRRVDFIVTDLEGRPVAPAPADVSSATDEEPPAGAQAEAQIDEQVAAPAVKPRTEPAVSTDETEPREVKKRRAKKRRTKRRRPRRRR